MGSFFFAGPTGVGKTELARTLAEVLFDNEDALVRIDMSEYMEKHAVSRLVGAPPGYIGHDEGGQLTEAVRRRPYSVVLFDEIEKAHFDVFNILLQVLDDGHLTDAQGRKVDMKNTILIMTSNLGTLSLSETQSVGFQGDDGGLSTEDISRQTRARVDKALEKTFRPEFLNRLDEIIIFTPLDKGHIEEILEKFLDELQVIAASKGMSLNFTSELKRHLAEEGFSPTQGARPLKRILQKKVENPISEALLRGDFVAGEEIVADLDDNDEVILGRGQTVDMKN
jgi:ATP-dependent Clp protease ATP-binding subunit ClpC